MNLQVSFGMRVFMILIAGMMTSQGRATAGTSQDFPAQDFPSQDSGVGAQVVATTAVWSVDAATPGQEVVLALAIDIDEGYHIGNSGSEIPSQLRGELMPTSFELRQAIGSNEQASQSFEIGEADFPSGEPNESLGVGKPGTLAGNPIIYIPIKINANADPGEVDFEWTLTFQACDDESCLAPETYEKRITLKVVADGTLTQGCLRPELFLRWSDRRAKLPADRTADFDYKSKEPPIGPPWFRDLRTAQTVALETGRPIFLYSTKTFCPHCVVVESEMLSSPELKDYYDRAVFLYVYRDFSGSQKDRQAERILDRYSLSSWPQLWLINPHDLSVMSATGRTVESFADATANIDFTPSSDLSPVKQLDQSEQRLVTFEAEPSLESALSILDREEDVVLQIAAVRFLMSLQEFDSVASRAADLLRVPNDPLRFLVLQAITKSGEGDAKAQVEAIATDPSPSRNFNVLRARAIEALGVCGDADSINAIEPHAGGSARNMTTRTSINSLVAVAKRNRTTQEQVVAILINSFPGHEQGAERLNLALASLIHNHLEELTGDSVELDSVWNESSRERMQSRWRSR